MLRRTAILILTAGLAAACADAPEPSEAPETAAPETAPAPATTASVRIIDPVEGVVVDGPQVTVTLQAEGTQILPAGDQTPNSGHHHLFLDADLSPAGEPIPSREGEIVHIGDGSGSYTFQNVTPGEHRLIAVLGDWQHIPVQPWVVDTVMITVR